MYQTPRLLQAAFGNTSSSLQLLESPFVTATPICGNQVSQQTAEHGNLLSISCI